MFVCMYMHLYVYTYVCEFVCRMNHMAMKADKFDTLL